MKAAPIAIAQPVIDRIRARVADAWIGYAPDDDAGWNYGTDAAFLARLRDHWLDRYDWRAAESAFNAHSAYCVEIDGIPIHFFRWKGGDYPLLLTHGWPGSVLEFMDAAPKLAAQGYDVIVPSLPGYGFSGRPSRPIGPQKVAAMWRTLMVDALGFQRFGAQGGDWGGIVTQAMGRAHGDVLGAIHLNMISQGPLAKPSPELDVYRAHMAELIGREGSYAAQHGTKPQTISLALADTPLGFAGWVIEKCRSWSDCDGDVEGLFGLDALITNVMTYLVTGNVQSGIWMYHGRLNEPVPAVRVEVPTGFAEYPREFVPPPPREAVEADYNIVRWNKMARGGHFAAWEQPDDFVEEVASFFAKWR